MKEIAGLPSHLTDMGPEQKRNVMGKDDFLKLLMAQLKYQDPMKPMDHQEFATQLAQFGQLEQLTNIGTGIQGLRSGQGEGSKLQALNLIGKKVEALGNEIELKEGQENVSLTPNLTPDTKPLAAVIYDSAGKVVREINLAGKVPTEAISWDGKNQDGAPLPVGKYTFRVHGVGKDGKSVEAGTALSGQVAGVEMDGATPYLVLKTASGTTRLELAKVRKVVEDAGASAAPGPTASAVSKTEPKAQIAQSITPTGDDGEDRTAEIGARAWQGMVAGVGGRR